MGSKKDTQSDRWVTCTKCRGCGTVPSPRGREDCPRCDGSGLIHR